MQLIDLKLKEKYLYNIYVYFMLKYFLKFTQFEMSEWRI